MIFRSFFNKKNRNTPSLKESTLQLQKYTRDLQETSVLLSNTLREFQQAKE